VNAHRVTQHRAVLHASHASQHARSTAASHRSSTRTLHATAARSTQHRVNRSIAASQHQYRGDAARSIADCSIADK
jgi:hypothetical protein